MSSSNEQWGHCDIPSESEHCVLRAALETSWHTFSKWTVCGICSSEDIVTCLCQMNSSCCVQHSRHSDISSASEPQHHNCSYGDPAMGSCWSRWHICMAKWIHSRHFDCQQLDPWFCSWPKQCPLHWLWTSALSHKPGKRLKLALLVLLFDSWSSTRFDYSSFDSSW